MIRAFAHHESGHAIAGLALGWKVERIEVLRHRDVGGLCSFAAGEIPAAVNAAGEVAGWLFAPEQSAHVAEADPRRIQAIMRRLPRPAKARRGPTDQAALKLAAAVGLGHTPDGEELAAATAEASAQARALLLWYGPEVRLVAELLMERREVSGAELDAVLCGWMPPRPGGAWPC